MKSRGEKSPKQRVAEAADALRAHGAIELRLTPERLAEIVLEQDDREPLKWPTDESCKAVQAAIAKRLPGYLGTDSREIARAALLPDPILRAAVAYRSTPTGSAAQGVIDAVNEAGL